ncbi:MAG: MgtC/SapB family protein [Pseudomonadota bacterium]
MDFTFLQNNGIELLPRFLTSIAIGLLIGLERERNPSAKAGLRTFALVALFGALMGMLGEQLDIPWLVAAGLIAVGLTIIAAYLGDEPDKPQDDPGTTTVIALLLCYALGVMVWLDMSELAVMLAIGITALLYFKPELRGFSQRLTRRDLVAVLQFAVLTFIVLPILPDQNYGPYAAFNPHQAWLMVVLISGISLAGYTALHLIGTRYGAPLLGFFGGLMSSTATTLIYAKHGKAGAGASRLAALVIVVASIVVMLRLLMEVAVVSMQALPSLAPVFAGGVLAGTLAAVYAWRQTDKGEALLMPETRNPAELHSAFGFGLLYVIVLIGSAWMSDLAGSQGLYAVALASGLTDVDAITISSLRLFNLQQLSEQQTVIAITLAFLANVAFKFGMVLFIGGRALARQVAIGFGAIACGVLPGLIAL